MAKDHPIRKLKFSLDLGDFDMSDLDDRQLANDFEMCLSEDDRKDPSSGQLPVRVKSDRRVDDVG